MLQIQSDFSRRDMRSNRTSAYFCYVVLLFPACCVTICVSICFPSHCSFFYKWISGSVHFFCFMLLCIIKQVWSVHMTLFFSSCMPVYVRLWIQFATVKCVCMNAFCMHVIMSLCVNECICSWLCVCVRMCVNIVCDVLCIICLALLKQYFKPVMKNFKLFVCSI